MKTHEDIQRDISEAVKKLKDIADDADALDIDTDSLDDAIDEVEDFAEEVKDAAEEDSDD
jgi:hypothetical protein